MRTRDWALVAFTLLMQASIGTILVTTVLLRSGVQGAFGVPVAAAAAAGGLALFASLFHLGRPAQAWLALANIRTSWLSREIIVSVLFVASAGGLVLLNAGDGGAPRAFSVAAAFGIAAIYSMSRLYMVPAQPAWNRFVTPLMFLGSGVLLGAVFVLAATSHHPTLERLLAVTAITLVVLQSALAAAFVEGLRHEPAAAISLASEATDTQWLTSARVGAASAAVAVLALLLAAPAEPASTVLAGLAFVFVLLSELAARVLFYQGRTSLGPFETRITRSRTQSEALDLSGPPL